MTGRPAGRAIGAGATALFVPALALAGVILMLGGAGANVSTPAAGVCGGGGTGQTVASVDLDAEQIGNARTIIGVVAGRRLPVQAAVIAVTVAVTESSLRNSTIHYDHDSEGLFQQRVRYYTAAVADDPVRATNAFLDRLLGIPDWRQQTVGTVAQAVQQSAYPQRYQPNVVLAQQLVGIFWPTATAAARPIPGPVTSGVAASALGTAPAVCAGAGGAQPGGVGPIVGPIGNNIAGVTAIPSGLVITGSTAGQNAVRDALAQLGKPYVWAAAGPDAYDCSGLTMAAWASAGVALPHHAADQIFSGTPEPTDLSQAVGGDLVMIPGADGTPAAPGHVGMIVGYTQDTGGRVLWLVQAPETGVPVELTEASRWAGQIVDVRHIG